ncbi:MAG: ATP-binding protein [Polyangiaceae bacterium]
MTSFGPNKPRFIVVTGGPGAGKTAILEVLRQHYPSRLGILPEAASIVFGGGFPRRRSVPARRAGQRAIFHVQRELEALAKEEGSAPLVLCDRGTIDGLAYWPGNPQDFFGGTGTTYETELARYQMVIHLRTPPADGGYDHTNPLRIETAEEAAEIDARIEHAWLPHPNRVIVENNSMFVHKVERVLALVKTELERKSAP